MTKTLQDLIDESIFISTEYQARLAEISGGSDWSVDFSAPSFTLQSDSSVTLTPYLLGTESENRGSWIWSWQELGHFPDSVVAAAIQARESGAQHGIAELTTDELALAEGLARNLTLATKALTGIYAHYPVTAGAGVRAWILLDGDALELEAPTVNRMGRVMAESLKSNTIVNQQRAVDTYARMRGAHIAWDTEATAVITATDGALRLWFDKGKISGIEAAEPQVDAAELARCAAHAVDLRQQLATERAEIERLAATEAESHRAAREQAHAAEVKARAQAEADAAAARAAEAEKAAELESVEEEYTLEQAQDQAVAEDTLSQQAEEPALPDYVEEENFEDVAGVVSTDRVYPNAEAPFDQDPQAETEPGRVTTSALALDEIVEEEPSASEAEAQAEQSDYETVYADEQIEQAAAERRAAFRVAGDAPDLEAEREEAAAPKEDKKEKKGFFSRFFGL